MNLNPWIVEMQVNQIVRQRLADAARDRLAAGLAEHGRLTAPGRRSYAAAALRFAAALAASFTRFARRPAPVAAPEPRCCRC